MPVYRDLRLQRFQRGGLLQRHSPSFPGHHGADGLERIGRFLERRLAVKLLAESRGDGQPSRSRNPVQKGRKVRQTYARQNVIRAWQASHNTVYLVYPETARIPANRFGHWENP
jgi:hypothetical protein